MEVGAIECSSHYALGSLHQTFRGRGHTLRHCHGGLYHLDLPTEEAQDPA